MNIDELQSLYQLIPFEPSVYDVEDDGDNEFYEYAVLSILEAFPDDYVAALKAARASANYDKVFVARLLNRGFLLDSLSDCRYGGIQVECMGSYFDAQGFLDDVCRGEDVLWSTAKEMWKSLVLRDDDLSEDSRTYETATENLDVIDKVVMDLLGPLQERDYSVKEPSHKKDIGWFIAWVFSMTGHPLLDTTNEELWENGYSYDEWTTANLQWTVQLIESRDKTMAAIDRGLILYLRDPEGFLRCLQKGMESRKCSRKVISWLNSVVSTTESFSENAITAN